MIVVQILNYLLLENKLSDSTVMNEKKKDFYLRLPLIMK